MSLEYLRRAAAGSSRHSYAFLTSSARIVYRSEVLRWVVGWEFYYSNSVVYSFVDLDWMWWSISSDVSTRCRSSLGYCQLNERWYVWRRSSRTDWIHCWERIYSGYSRMRTHHRANRIDRLNFSLRLSRSLLENDGRSMEYRWDEYNRGNFDRKNSYPTFRISYDWKRRASFRLAKKNRNQLVSEWVLTSSLDSQYRIVCWFARRIDRNQAELVYFSIRVRAVDEQYKLKRFSHFPMHLDAQQRRPPWSRRVYFRHWHASDREMFDHGTDYWFAPNLLRRIMNHLREEIVACVGAKRNTNRHLFLPKLC